MVTIKHCDNEVEAQVVKQKLAEYGIEASILSETTSFGGSTGIGQRISVSVNDENEAEALAIIMQTDNERDESMPWCPLCGSENISKTEIRCWHGPFWQLFIGIIIAAVTWFMPVSILYVRYIGLAMVIFWFVPYKSIRYHCCTCNKDFKRS